MTQFADSSETILATVAESVFGATPSNPAFLKVRFTGETLTPGIENTTSAEIRPDAGVADLIQVGSGVNGDVNFELSYDANLQTILADCLRGAWATNVLKRGVLKPSRAFEKKFELGATDSYHRFNGVRMGGLNLTFQAKEKVTATAPVMGTLSGRGTAAIAGATYGAASTKDVMKSPKMANLAIGGITGTVYFTSLSVQMTHNLRMQPACGSLAAVGIGYGQTVITGSLSAYFDATSAALYDLAVAGTASSLGWDLPDDEGNNYAFLLPRLKFNNPRVLAQGNNQDVLVQLDYQALIDSGEATDFKITRAPASP